MPNPTKIAMATPVAKNESSLYLKDLRRKLGERWQNNRTKIERVWKAMGRKQREEIIKAGAADGSVLLTHTDQSMGDVFKVIPEWNLNDLAKPGSNYLLEILKFRATTSLSEQYRRGPRGGPGDEAFIIGSMRINGLRHGSRLTDTFTVFWSEEEYGHCYDTEPGKYAQVMDFLSGHIEQGTCVHKSIGELIINRQIYFLQTLTILVADILDCELVPQGRVKLGPKAKSSKTPERAVREVIRKLSIEEKPKISVSDMVSLSSDHKSDLEDHLYLCRHEPLFLYQMVNVWLSSRPELVPDEMGRTASAITSKDINAAIFEVLHNAVTEISIWGYILELLRALTKEQIGRAYKGIILQELANVFHFEYRRTQNVFKRFLQTGTDAKCFKRISGASDDGQARVKTKGKPDALAGKETQASCLLHICQPETDFGRAVDWTKTLDKIYDTKPTQWLDLRDNESDAFGDLVTTTSFMQCLSQAMALPTPNPRKGQTYLSRFKALGIELSALKEKIDLVQFASPIEKLEDEGVALRTLETFQQFIVEQSGANIGFLYQDLNETCLSELQRQYQRENETKERTELDATNYEPPSLSRRIEERQQKIKTSLSQASTDGMTPTAVTDTIASSSSSALQVSISTLEVFTTILKSSDPDRSVKWISFQFAMSELFTTAPRFGAMYTFRPQPDRGIKKPITCIRPSDLKIEGYRLLVVARRLKTRFGWSAETFQLAPVTD